MQNKDRTLFSLSDKCIKFNMQVTILTSVFGWLLLSIQSVTCQVDCEAQCDMLTWNPVLNESAYDRDPNSLNDVLGRPLGFSQQELLYSDNADPLTPCISITSAADRRIEIMVETDPPATICVRDVDRSDEDNVICQESIYNCRQAPMDTVTFQFFCHGNSAGRSCDQSSVNFWYRFVVSTLPSVEDPEEWCDNRDSGQYPSSLVDPQDRVLVPAATEKPRGGGVSLSTTVAVVLVAPLLVILALH